MTFAVPSKSSGGPRRAVFAVPSLVLAAALLAAGCSGPRIEVSIGGKSVPVDVAFGEPPEAVLAQPAGTGGTAPGQLVPVPGGGLGVLPVTPVAFREALAGTPVAASAPPGPVEPTAPSRAVPTIPPPQTCQQPPPGAGSRQAAGQLVTGTPPPGNYPVRFSSEFSTGRTDKQESGVAAFTVGQPTVSPGGGVRFSVTTNLLGQSTSFDYFVQPPATDTTTPAGQTPGGGMIALTQVTGTGGYGYQASFHPSTGLELLALPAYIGASWQQASADAASGTVAQVDGQVQAEVPVHACASVVDTRESNATIIASSQNENVTTTVQTFFATQYGGLPVQEVESYSGTAGGQHVSGTLTWTYEVDPGAAR